MPIVCKNCNKKYKGNYCNQCGQSSDVHEINLKFLWHDIQHGLLHFDKGMVYTIPQLYRNPGKMIHNYLDGKRVKHSKPFTLVFLLATVFILEKHLLNIHINIELKINQIDYTDWIFNHFSISAIAILPMLALWSFLFFRKQGNNYTEHLVLNAYLTSQCLAFFIVFMPLFKLSQNLNLSSQLTNIGELLYLVILLWNYFTFFTIYRKSTIVFKSLLIALLALITVILVIIIVAIVIP